MTEKWTKGPWRVSSQSNLELTGEFCRIFLPSGVGVAVYSMGDDTKTVEANALLIAAAPDLVEALEALETEASRIGEYLGKKGQGSTVLGLRCLAARAALAKARGEG